MRQNPHVRICGGPGSATTLVYPTAFTLWRFGGGGVRHTPSSWCRHLHTRGRGGRRGRFVADQFGRMFTDENNVVRGTSETRF